MTSTQLTAETLQFFSNFANTQERLLRRILDDTDIKTAVKGEKIIELGDTSDDGFFLVKGTLILKAADGGTRTIEAGSESARNQIAQLIPRRYQVFAATEVEYLRIPNPLINSCKVDNTFGISSSIIVDESQLDDHNNNQRDSEIAFENEISYQLYHDLKADRLVLPSLPDIAVRIGRALKNENNSAKHISELVQADPAICAKLVKACNSPLYSGAAKVDSCHNAVVRLGMQTTHKLVMTFALKDLYKTTSALLNRRMKKLWDHSTRVAAISHVLAKKLGKFDPDHALLAGLVHDIGVLAILVYALEFPEAQSNKGVLDNVIANLRGQIGSMILRSWDFPEDLHNIPIDAENWSRAPSESQADYSDLIIIAQMHSFIGTPEMKELPAIDSVPAFKRLKLTQLTPTMSLKILDEARNEIEDIRRLLI